MSEKPAPIEIDIDEMARFMQAIRRDDYPSAVAAIFTGLPQTEWDRLEAYRRDVLIEFGGAPR